MEQRAGVSGTILNEVFFTEERIPGATVLKHLRVEISRQNANLGEVKARLSHKAKRRGADAVMSFRYGQTKHRWWQLFFLFRWDTESWFGEGDAIKL
ncbi:MAG: hypothetical protein WB699_04215 [Bacteroidota bacterium]